MYSFSLKALVRLWRSNPFAGLDIEIVPGECVGLIGRNGSGKSTLMRLLAGEDAEHLGTVKLAQD